MHPPIPRVRGPRQGLRPRSCAHTFSAGFAPLAPKNPSFSMRRLPRACPNMPTDRKLGSGIPSHSTYEIPWKIEIAASLVDEIMIILRKEGIHKLSVFPSISHVKDYVEEEYIEGGAPREFVRRYIT